MNKKSIKKAIYFLGIFAVTLATAFPASAASIANTTTVITNAISSSDIGTTSVNVSGVFNAPGSTSVSTRFDWGLTPSLGNSTSFVQYSTVSGTMNATISGLVSGQQYYVRAYALGNVSGAGFGSTLSFTTKSITVPTVMTTSSSSVSTNSATLNGVFNGNNASSTDVMFEYGTTSSNLNQTTGFVTQNAPSGTFSANLSGLSANTTYYFRAVAKNSAGTTNASTILSFTTSTTPTPTCSISSFYASPSTINSGNNTTLYWTTSNCTNVSIDNGVGTVSNGTSSYTTGAIYNNTTFTMTAYGTSGSTQTATAYVTIGNTNNSCYINSFYASPSSVNYGGSTTIYWSTSNCNSAYLSSYGSAGTSGSWNTGALYGQTNYTLTAYGNNGSPSQTITVYANQNNGCTYNCNPCTYNCYPNPDPYYPPTPQPPQIIYVDGGTNYYDTSYNEATVGDALTLSIDSGFPEIYPNDFITYSIKYKNIGTKNVHDAELRVELPREVELVGYTTGVTSNDRRTITVSLGTLSVNESGSISIDVRADNYLSKRDRVLVKASLEGEFWDGTRTSVSDYSIVSVKAGKNPLFGATALFGDNGFLPHDFGGWIILIALIAIVVFLGKHMYQKRKNINAYGAHTYSAYPTNSEHDRNAHH